MNIERLFLYLVMRIFAICELLPYSPAVAIGQSMNREKSQALRS
jgi:hypothetical protein